MKTVIIMGHARSGTSLTTGILNIMGVNIAYNTEADPGNPKGSFEHTEFNDAVIDLCEDREDVEDFRELVQEHQSELWGFKCNPARHCMEAILPELAGPHLVVVMRNPINNAISWMKHMWEHYNTHVGPENALKTVSDGNVELTVAAASARVPKVFVAFEDIIKNPLEEAETLAQFVGVKLTDAQKEEIANFVIN